MQIERSKRGIPCLWECGGGMSNTGDSQIICDKDGKPKKPIYIRRSGSLACDNHALIPIRTNDVVVIATHHRGDFSITIYKITSISDTEDACDIQEINSFYDGEWNNSLGCYADAVEAAKSKARSYHCRTAYFIKEE